MEDQDIRNIGKAFGIDQVTRHENDEDSVLGWIEEWEYSRLLFYKLQGGTGEGKDLKEEDFMIVVQTVSQRHLMQKFLHRWSLL